MVRSHSLLVVHIISLRLPVCSPPPLPDPFHALPSRSPAYMTDDGMVMIQAHRRTRLLLRPLRDARQREGVYLHLGTFLLSLPPLTRFHRLMLSSALLVPVPKICGLWAVLSTMRWSRSTVSRCEGVLFPDCDS